MVTSPLVCPTLVGRETPLRALVDRLGRAAGGEGNVLLLGGDAGVGKTRIVRELKREATGKGVRVIEGRCSSAESSVPYAPLMDALRFRIARGEGEVAARMLGPLRGMLAPLFPQLEGEQPTDAERPPDRPFELIYRVLERLATDEPMLLVLEDIHWADPTSLELLHHLAHRATALRLLLVATYSSDELHTAHPLRRLLALLARERAATQMQLEPLDRAGTVELMTGLLGAEPDDALATAIWRRAEGNAFFVEELVAALAAHGAMESTGSAAALERMRLPSTVSEVVLARVHALGPRALETLSAAAVIGRRAEFDILREVLDVPEETLIETLEQLVAHQLLREERDGGDDVYAFPHALMQEALYENIISRRRRLLHRRIANAIERRPARRTSTRLDELAYHFRSGGDHERAYDYARRAGDEAARLHAWDDAAAHCEHALASLDALADDGSRAAELLEQLADIAWRQGRAAPRRQYLEEAIRLRRTLGHAERTAHLLRRLAALRVEEGSDEAARAALEEALQLLSDYPQSRELGPIYDDLGQLMLARGDVQHAEPLLIRGLSLASHAAHSAEEVLALVSLGELGVFGGEVAVGVARLDVALELLKEGALPFERATRVYASGVRTLLLAHEYERALRWADTARDASREQKVAGLEAFFGALRAVVQTITGATEDPLTEVSAAVETLRRAERAELRDALRALGFVHRVRGSLDAARQIYEELLALGERDATVGLALIELAHGRAATAVGVLEQALAAVPAEQPLLARRLAPYVVEALVEIDRVSDAAEIVARETIPDDARAGAVELRYATGLVRLAQGNPNEARQALAAAAASWDALGNRLEAARARVALLDAILAAGDAAEGVTLGRRLVEQLERFGMARERDHVRRLLRRAGIRTRPNGRTRRSEESAVAPLTSREDAVLREVALGRTNREIADALGISEKTVGVHVSHILEKLGCRTRTQAARFVPR